ncbi:type II restriction endonuclease [Desulfonema magnum]|uniref:Restriction endonuclease domain-containing protein n=1 Tax=Desulfonema magnum TaxID=45655 RepID=A0A975BFU5_9BACT|nr:type II restriction endonuclease [Desulfonema magnum]QTA84591.1 Restriction endonuclease domain-containing protein [Desulfonema magnum]
MRTARQIGLVFNLSQILFAAFTMYQIALDRPGTGNTKNIGSVINIDKLIHGKGPFTDLGEDIDVLSHKRYGKGC